MAIGAQQAKPVVHGVFGENLLLVLAKVSKALEKLNRSEDAREMRERALSADSYEEALQIVGEYALID
jgi:hypothetical protein